MDFNILADLTVEELEATKTGLIFSNITYPPDSPYSELPDMLNNDTAPLSAAEDQEEADMFYNDTEPLSAAEDQEGALRNLQSLPSSLDWRTRSELYPKGCVTPVQDQGKWSVRVGC